MSKQDERERLAHAIADRWQKLGDDARARADGEMLAIELTQEEIDHVFERRVSDLMDETIVQHDNAVGSAEFVTYVVALHRVGQMEPHVTQATRERLEADFQSVETALDDDD